MEGTSGLDMLGEKESSFCSFTCAEEGSAAGSGQQRSPGGVGIDTSRIIFLSVTSP